MSKQGGVHVCGREREEGDQEVQRQRERAVRLLGTRGEDRIGEWI